MELAEREAAEFKNWNSSMNQKDHKDWFRGMYITLLEKYINKYYTVDLNMCMSFPGFTYEVPSLHCFSKNIIH